MTRDGVSTSKAFEKQQGRISNPKSRFHRHTSGCPRLHCHNKGDLLIRVMGDGVDGQKAGCFWF